MSQRKRPVTMRDVAELANVSQSTVSRVLSRTEQRIPISEATRTRVMDAVEELGYLPNLHARSLRGQKTRLIAILIADIANAFYHPIVRAAQDVAHQHGYDVIIANSDHLREREEMFCESLIQRPVDGVIMVPYHLSADELGQLRDRTGAEVAVLGQHIEDPAIDVVYGTDDTATYGAVQWLVQVRGHQRIGYIGVTPAFSAGERRRQAYISALVDAGLAAHSHYTGEGDWTQESGFAQMQRLMRQDDRPTAVLACNDNMAIGAMLAAEEMGLRVPDDVAVVGFDDIPAASWVHPRLTTIAQSSAEMGRCLATMLFDRMEGVVTGPGRRVEIPCRFIERESA